MSGILWVKTAGNTAAPKYLPVRCFRITATKEVSEGTRRRDLGVPGVEDHADVFGYDSRLDAVVEL